MTDLRTVAALLLPWICGVLLCRAVLPRRSKLEQAAAGWFVGQFVAVLSLLIMLRTGFHEGAWTAAAPVIAFGVAGALIARFRRTKESPESLSNSTPHSKAWLVLAMAAGASIVVKLCLIAMAATHSPIRHDDAIAIWLVRAKVIAGLGYLPLDPASPLYLGGAHADYPLTASLFAAWVAIVAGAWNESAVTLPWSLAFLNLLLLTFALLRRRCWTAVAVMSAWGVSSLPLMLVHVIHPGYADLWLAAFLAAAVLYFLDWRDSREAAPLGLGLLFCLAAACMKREGIIPAGCAALVFVAPRLVHRRGLARTERIMLAGGAALALTVAWFAMPRVAFADPLIAFSWNPGALGVLVRHAASWGSFGPFWIAASIAMIVGIRRRDAWPAIVFSLLLMGYAVAVFVLTDNARFAFNDQTPSRVLLQIAPSTAAALAWALGPRRSAVDSHPAMAIG